MRQKLFNRVHHFHGVDTGLTLHRQHDGAVVVEPACHLVILHTVENPSQFLQANRATLPISDNQGTKTRRVLKLPAGLHREHLVFSVKRARGQVHIPRADGGMHFVNADAERCQLARIELHPHRVRLRTKNTHLRHAIDHGDLLRQHRLAVVIHGRKRQSGRRQREKQNGRIGGIHLVVARRRGHVRRQLSLRLGDGRLHVLRRRINVALQTELNGDLR